MTKAITNLILVFFLIISLAVIYVAVKLVLPLKVFEYKKIVAVPKVKAGDTLAYEVFYCNYVNAPAMVSRQLLSNTGVVITPDASSILPKGCGSIKSSIPIPNVAAPGVYKMAAARHYVFNGFHTYTAFIESNEFEITK